jgi:sigma-B regulation protein RsbU (phosphoserine phosphatase)
VPVGLFYDQQFSSTTYDFSPGDSLVLYTDGLTEALGPDGTEYGAQRLARVLERCVDRSTHELLQDCIDDVLNFRADPRQMDDQSMMVLQFAPTRQ